MAASEAGRGREGESGAAPVSGKQKLVLKHSASVLSARTPPRGHLAVRDSVGEVLAGQGSVPKEIRVLLEGETRECLMGKQPSVSVSASHSISLKLSVVPLVIVPPPYSRQALLPYKRCARMVWEFPRDRANSDLGPSSTQSLPLGVSASQ